MEKGFEFNINQDFYLYMTDKNRSLNSQEFAYQYSKDKLQEPLVLAELKTETRTVKLCLEKNRHGFYAISKYYIYDRNTFERASEDYKEELISEMCNVLGKDHRSDFSYEHYLSMKESFLTEMCFVIKENSIEYRFKKINELEKVSGLNENTYFNNLQTENEVELLKLMLLLI